MAPKSYKQKHSSTCGIAVIRNILKNKFNINRTQDYLVKLAERLYKQKHDNKPINTRYKIKENGTDVYHFINLAKYFKLKVFSKSFGNIRHLKFLINQGIWPILHRPSELDGDGHYIIVLGYSGSYIYLFDPSKLNGGLKKESYKTFINKWTFLNERWFIFYYKDKLNLPFKGKYL